MHDRHEGMEAIGKANKVLHRELAGELARPWRRPLVRRGRSPTLSRKASGWFPKGTGPELGKTGAKPEIWQNWPDFAAKLA